MDNGLKSGWAEVSTKAGKSEADVSEVKSVRTVSYCRMQGSHTGALGFKSGSGMEASRKEKGEGIREQRDTLAGGPSL